MLDPPMVGSNDATGAESKYQQYYYFVLSQSTRVVDGRAETDRITTPKTALALLRRAVKKSLIFQNCSLYVQALCSPTP